ncbi:ATP-binding protein [Massilia sp. CCM 9210]|uniref:AAA family ATPase n=1 Tax=Massilia scottii TaxID=3057166 RepID=UPI0027967B35|nr:ATP-binding protein [Massilia sp. CCM 9210]MDQ1812865.1 ATP-binding protein [Massilia sp. CCM 9210]
METTDAIIELEDDFANLARLAASGAVEDVRLYLAKLVRKHRTYHPEFASRLDQTLKATQTRSLGPSIMRRNGSFDSTQGAMPADADSKMSLIRVFDDLKGIECPILSQSLLGQLGTITQERKERDRLAAHGIRPTRSAVFVGPPGVGKTLSARWLAAQIGKPLWVLDLTTVMSSLLGKTGNNLRMVFEHAKENEAVLLLDEVDAIAKRRSDESDVGELKRLVTAILQEVDAWPDTGLLLAATNHPELIDPALWRRFDAILTFGLADTQGVEAAVRRYLGPSLDVFAPWIPMLVSSLQKTSLSDVERTVTSLRRSVVLQQTDPARLVIELATRNASHLDKVARRDLAIELARSGSLSHNQISEMTGVARDTLRKYAGPSPIKGRGPKKGT